MGRESDVDIRIGVGSNGSIRVGGYEMAKLINNFMLSAKAGELPVLTLEASSGHAHYEGRAIVGVTSELEQALIEMGWTPPSESNNE